MMEQDFVEQMKDITGGDPEGGHVQGDDILIAALRHLGWGVLADEWERQANGWWWA